MDALLSVRCDPAHVGHWLLVHDALERFDQVIVGIRDTQDDLFSTDDRFRIAVKAFGDIARCTVVIIPDLAQCQAWADVAKFDVVVTGNDEVKYAAQKYYAVMDSARHGHYSATEIRRRLELGLDISDQAIPGTIALIWQLYERQRILSGRSA